MRIFAFVDLHGDLELFKKIMKKLKKNKPDLIIMAGDLCWLGRDIEYLLKKLDKLKVPVLFVHGNHESANNVKEICENLKNVYYIHASHYEKEGILFFGYGDSGFGENDPKFRKLGVKFKELIKPNQKVILISHGPPHKTELDKLFSSHAGCKDIRGFIEEVQPILVICGHLHENFYKKDKIGKSLVVNPGPEGMFFEI